MNVDIDHLGSIKEEMLDVEVGIDECTNTKSFLYVDTNNYNNHSFENIDVKQEEEYVEDIILDSKSNEFFVEENFPLNTIKNLVNHSDDENSVEVYMKTNKENLENSFLFSNKSLFQKENVKSESPDSDNVITESKRYKLRTRPLSKKLDYKSPKYSIRSEKTVKVSCRKKNSCDKCKNVFLTKNELQTHKAVRVNFKCFKCNKCFCSDTFLNKHKQGCNGSLKNNKNNIKSGSREYREYLNIKSHNLVFSCQKCFRCFKNKVSLESHILQNECCKSEIYICAYCEVTFTQKRLLKTHVKFHLTKSMHSFGTKGSLGNQKCKKTTLNVCHICDKKFSQLSRLKIHLLHHKESYKCAKCKKSFATQISLDNHFCKYSGSSKTEIEGTEEFAVKQKAVQNDKSDFNNCDHSGLNKPDSNLNRKSHLKSESTKKSRHKCDICGKKFIKFFKLKIHILNIHQGINYQCDKCSTKFQSQEDLDIHVTKQDCKAENLWTCNTCGKQFAKRDYLKKHQYMHMNILFKCKYCYCAFMKEKSYKRHMEKMNCSKSARKIKMSEYNYKKCRICDLEYETEELLIKHFKTLHINSEPHQCFCCESCLPTFRDLQNHIHHHNIQKYTCNLCGKPYTSQEGFRKHRLKHKGAEFKCKFCYAEFLNENRFRFHEKTCKRNPENGYEPTYDKERQRRKDGRPKQSRQLHWESRIIVKHLRGDPKTCAENQKSGLVIQQENSLACTFFEESETETSEKGWFDKYYKTDEDDIAFGVKKIDGKTPTNFDVGFDEAEVSQTNPVEKREFLNGPDTFNSNKADDNEIDAEDYWSGSASEEFSSSSEEKNINTICPIDYNPKKCRLCLTTFSQEYELLHHFIKSHPDEYAHKCPECGVQSPLFAQLKEHMKSHGIGIGVFNCDNCSKQFKSEKKMNIHKIRCKGVHSSVEASGHVSLPQTDNNRCKKCGKTFHTKFGYRKHKQLCSKKIKKTFDKSINLPIKKPKDNTNDDNFVDDRLHLSDSEEVPENRAYETKNLVCNEEINSCKYKSSEPIVKKEKTTVEVKNIYPGEPPVDSFPCRLCDKKFQYERGLVMHFKSAHPGNKPLVCHVCNMHLADKLKEHLKTHGIGEEFICELCGKRFNQKFLSKIHEMWHQGIEFKCSNCKQKFLNKEKMEKHIGENRCSNRQSLMRLPCDICGKSYRSKFGLNKHYITHTPKELRPVKNRMNCEYCGKWFENNNGLQRHRRIHTGERPFCCRFCPKAFAQEGNCKAHERIHTGESKPRKKKFPPVPTFTNSSLPPPPPLSPHLSTPAPSAPVVSQIPPPPPLAESPQISGANPQQIAYPGHVDLFIYSTVDTTGIVN